MTDDPLTILRQHRVLESIDVHFARFIGELDGSGDRDVVLGAALVSRATGAGDICLDLQSAAGTVLTADEAGRQPVVCPGLNHWAQRLADSAVVGRPGDRCPLILDDRHRLYLYRYWRYEKDLSDAVSRRVRSDRTAERVDRERLRSGLQRLFPPRKEKGVDWQKVAALVAVLKSFCVITGGPGTGKTSTVAAISALLLEQPPEGEARIFLAAPTGKAAARLGEALRAARDELPVPEPVRSRLPVAAVTIHRLLRSLPGTASFRHSASNPLAADAVIVDEASMVDLALMAKLVQSLEEHTRLVLIGDRDQLASVEAGAVLDDLCGRSRRQGVSGDLCRTVADFTGEQLPSISAGRAGPGGLRDGIVELQQSHRFAADSGIGALSRHVNRAEVRQALNLLQDDSAPAVRWASISSAADLRRQLAASIAADIGEYRKTPDPRQALTAFNRLGLLCAVNRGPCGVDAVNRLVEHLLSAQGRIRPAAAGSNPWYAGRPVMITRNDYHLGLFNGDIGIAMPASPDPPGVDLHDPGPARLMVYFQNADDPGLRQIPAYRLSDHQTVYAMTVHKSQGSEFDTVHLILPQQDAMVLTRELIYTAVTRARRQVVIWAPEHLLTTAIRRKIRRSSGLRDALWGR